MKYSIVNLLHYDTTIYNNYQILFFIMYVTVAVESIIYFEVKTLKTKIVYYYLCWGWIFNSHSLRPISKCIGIGYRLLHIDVHVLNSYDFITQSLHNDFGLNFILHIIPYSWSLKLLLRLDYPLSFISLVVQWENQLN